MNHYSTEDILKHINQQTQPELYNAILSILFYFILKFFNENLL